MVTLKKKIDPIVYESGTLRIAFNPLTSIEAEAYARENFHSMPHPDAWGFDEFLKLKVFPVLVASKRLVSISGIAFDDGESVPEKPTEAEAYAYLNQLIDCGAFGDLYAFLEALAAGQKKTSLTL